MLSDPQSGADPQRAIDQLWRVAARCSSPILRLLRPVRAPRCPATLQQRSQNGHAFQKAMEERRRIPGSSTLAARKSTVRLADGTSHDCADATT
eukprot:7126525-Prymnesium_polylepis.2